MNLEFYYVSNINKIRKEYSLVICKLCDKPLVKPVQCSFCREIFCHKCYHKTYISCCTDGRLIDPNGNSDILFNGQGNIEKKLGELDVYCAENRFLGCKWQGKRKNYIEHYQKCSAEYLKCYYTPETLINSENHPIFVCHSLYLDGKLTRRKS